MGKYDQYLAGLPASGGGKYDAFTKDLGTKQPDQGVLSAVGEALNSRPELKPYGGVQDFEGTDNPLVAAEQTLAAPIRAGMTMSQPGFRKAGESVAESLGSEGINPNVAAGAGTALSMVPDVVQAGQSIKFLMTSKNPYLKAIRTTPEQLGPEFQAGEKAAGISGDLPVQKGGAPRFPNLAGQPSLQPPAQAPLVAPKSYPKDFPSFYNFANSRIKAFGDKLSPQELDDYKTMLKTSLSKMKTEGLSKTEEFALGSDLQSKVTDLHNQAIPGREALNKVYAISKTIHPEMGPWIKQGIQKYGAKAIYAVLAGLGIGAGAKMASR